MKRALFIVLAGLIIGTTLTCQAEDKQALTTARASVVRLILKTNNDNKHLFTNQLQEILRKQIEQESGNASIWDSVWNGTPMAIATAVVIAKDTNTGYTHFATTYPFTDQLVSWLYIQGPQGLESIDSKIVADPERGMFFLKAKTIRENLNPASIHPDAISRYQSNQALNEKILLISFPKGGRLDDLTDREPSLQEGTITAISKHNKDGSPIIQTGITAHMNSSGGGIFNSNGELIAMAGFEPPAEGFFSYGDSKDPKSWTLQGVPANFLRDYLKTYGIRTSEPVAVVSAPEPVQVISAPEQEPKAESFGFGAIAGVIVGVLALGGVAFAVRKAKSKKSDASGKKMQLRYAGSDNMLRTQGPWRISESGISVGREAQIRLNSEKASGLHARFVFKQDKAFVEHLSQTNSTLVNGQLITGQQSLNVGDRIQIAKGGDDVFLVEEVV